ncbi:MAG: C69 family dipeptidase [Bacteroidaceae bacterium]|nr:C69 family dipeptidase [Bacteroidaceae bacterium]
MKRLTIALLAIFAATINAMACTNLIVGKNASADGSVMISYSADSYGMFGYLYHSPAGTHEKGEMIDIYDWDDDTYHGQIAQVAQTYNVIGNMNEFQVSIGETTFGGREELVDKNGIIDYGSLIYIALQRSRTAREAIRIMTDLVQQYGYASSGESFSIADPNEAWIMEMIGKGTGNRGAVWVAVRIPDDCIAAHANQSRIHKFNMDDKENVMYASDVISFAREKGYFNGVNKDFDFADAYNPLDFGGLRYCEARVWSFYNRYTNRGAEFLPYILGNSSEPMPLYVKPNKKLTLQDVQNMMRDHYEGTALDITQDVGAGAYHTPYRLSPLSFEVDGKQYFNERPISTQQSAWVFVSQLRSNMVDAVGGVFWFGCDDANMTVFTPVYCCTDVVPTCYKNGVDGADAVTFSFNSAFWVMNWVANMVYPRYDLMIEDVKAIQSDLENTFFQAQNAVEATALALYQEDAAKAKTYLTNYTNMMAMNTIDVWKRLGEYLVVKYNDGVVKKMPTTTYIGKNTKQVDRRLVRPGFPEGLKQEIARQTGDRYKMP